MSKYKTRDSEVEAVQWFRSKLQIWKDISVFGGLTFYADKDRKGFLFLETSLGEKVLNDGDFIVKQSNGCISVLSPHVFNSIYES